MPYDESKLIDKPRQKRFLGKPIKRKVSYKATTLKKLEEWEKNPKIIGFRLRHLNCPKLIEHCKKKKMELYGRRMYFKEGIPCQMMEKTEQYITK